jgi:hypothetical protein
VIFGSVQINGHQTTEQCTGQGMRGGKPRAAAHRKNINRIQVSESKVCLTLIVSEVSKRFQTKHQPF